ncbi:MAG: glycosyltransferase family 2 protein [Acidobacteria bacterium]|nr:glycosyltransferase family 2 protein [Acidobacteriota bacterium]
MSLMKLTVAIPTYNRAELLRRTLLSLAAAEHPRGLEVCALVVDNNSTDETRRTVEECQQQLDLEIRYLFEPRQGKSRALNTAIETADGDLLGMIDDDEEVAPNWLTAIADVFGQRWTEVDFIGGRYVPQWELEPPRWIPKQYTGVVGFSNPGEEELPYGSSFKGMMPGGNAVVKLSVLREVGGYNESLGPVGKNLMGCEDDDMYHRLLDAGKRGLYCPQLNIYHRVPAYRLTKKYFRRWCYGWGASQSVIDRHRAEYTGPRVLGVPRYLYGDAARGALRMVGSLLRLDRDGAFAHELSLWVLAGFFRERKEGRVLRAEAVGR